MPYGFGGSTAGLNTGATTVMITTGEPQRVPDGVVLLTARFQRAGNDLVIIPANDGAPVLIANFFARSVVPDLEEASGMRLSGRLVAELAGNGEAAGDWAARLASVDANAAWVVGDAADVGEGVSPSSVDEGAAAAVSVAAESALGADGVEVSAGGDENALPGDTIAVTQAIDAFNLHPQSMAYGPSRFESITLPAVDFTPPKDDDTALLLLRTPEQVSLPPPLEVTRWDNGRRWEAIGSFIEISGSEPEAPVEAGRLITARDGFMARLEADVTISTEQIAKFLGIDMAALQAAVPASAPASGTAMRIANSLSLGKGETIHFDVFFDGASHLPFNDAAIMTVRTQGRTLTVPISSIAELDAAGRGGSGWLTVSYTTGVAGSYAFGFAVLNDDDGSPSRLYVDHVRRGSAVGTQLEAVHTFADSLGGATTVQRPLPGFHEPVQHFVLSADGSLTFDALANVIDPDGYDDPRLDGIDRSGTLGTVHFNGLGTITYDPRDFYRALAAGERGTDHFLYRIDGGNGGLASARVEVTLSEAGVNDAPIAVDDSAIVDLERLARTGLPQTIAVLLNDDDIDSDDDRSTLRILSATSDAGADVTIVRSVALTPDVLAYDASAVAAARSLSLGEILAGGDWITYRIADRWGATAEARVAITWIGANDAPTANPDIARIGQDGAAVIVDVLANDDDVDSDDDASSLRLIAAGAERGTALVTADQRLSISASGFAGLALGEEARYGVRYTIADRHGATAEGRVDVVVVGANDAPIAVDDRAEAIEDGEPIAINVLANDDDIDSDDDASTLTVLSARSARGAAVVVGADGILHYHLAGVPAFDALREGERADAFDIITYVVSDRHGATAEGRVEVTVIGRNDPIDARDDVFVDDGFGQPRAVTQNRIDPLPVLGNDIDPDRGDTRTITHINGIAATADGSWLVLPSGVAVAVLATGEIAVDPRGRFDWLAVGESAVETFTYTVADGYGSSDTATVTLIVRGLNDAPVARDDVAESDAETPLRVFVLANDDDPDRSDRLTLTGIDSVSDLFAVGADDSVVFDPRGRLQYLSLGQTEQFWLRYEIADPHGATAAARVIVTVHGVNDAPIAGDDEFLVFADVGIAPTLGASLLDNDRDPDAGDRLRVMAVNGDGTAVGRPVALPAGGLLTVFADGTFAYDPLGAFDPLANGELATVAFSYMVGDGHGAEDTARVTLIVRGVNDAPVARPDAAAAVENGGPIVVDVLANDFDPDGSAETATLRLISAVSASGADVRVTDDGKIAYATLAAFDWLALGQIATDEVIYTVRDVFGAEAQGRLTVTITGRNDAPTAVADVAHIAADGVAVIDVRANDDDVDRDDDAASLRLIAATTAWGETVAITADGQLALDARDIAAFRALGAGAVRTFEGAIVYTIADRHGATAMGSVDLVVSGVNDPITAVDDAFTVGEDEPAQLAVGANDVDPDVGDGRHIIAINGTAASVGERIRLPSGAILTVLAGGNVNYDPAGSFGGLGDGDAAFDRFTYTIADDAGSSDAASVTVTVTGRNASPVAQADTAVTQQDAQVRIAVLANDSDPDARDTLSIAGLDQAQTLGRVRINADGTVTYDPAGAFAGLGAGATATDTFSYTVTDGRGGAARATVTVTIHGTGEATTGAQQLLFPFEVSDDDPANARFPGWRQEPAPGSGTTSVAQIGVFDGRLAGFSTTHLDKAAVLTASGGPVTGIVDLLNLPAGSLSGTRGSALGAQVGVGPGDVGPDGHITLSFDWNFVSGETGNPAALDDRAIFAISDGTGVSEATRWFVFTLAELAEFAGSDGAATGWRTSVFDLSEAFAMPAEGLSLTLGFAVTSAATLINPSRLLLDNVRFNGAPSADATLIGDSGDDRFTTWRQNPTAIDDGLVGTVSEDGALVIAAGDLVANDFASVGATAASRRIVAATTESGRGVATVSNGSVHYLAAGSHDDLGEGEQRVETLIYTLTDANGGADTARARIIVTGVNDAPVAAAVAVSTSEDVAVAIDIPALLALARDPDIGDRLSFVGIDAAGISGVVSSDAFTIRYDPGSAFQRLAVGQTATETVHYTVQDRLGAQGIGAITVTIIGRNDAPTALNDAFAVSEDGATFLNVLANDTDIDGDALRISHINGSAVPADGVYQLPSGARLIVDPARGVIFDAFGRYDWLAKGESIAETFTYTITDVHGEGSEALVTLTVVGANDPPQARNDHAATDEDAMVRIAVLANDSDADVADRLSVLSVDTAGTIGRVRIAPDGSLVYDPDGRFDGLFVGQSVTDTFRYTASDGHGGLSSATVQVTIHGSGTPQSHPQQLLSSFEIPWQQAGPGWEAEPFARGVTSPIRLTAAFDSDFGVDRAIRDDLRAVLADYVPTHLDQAVQLAAFGSSGRGPGIQASAIESFLELPGGALPDDTGSFSGEQGDGSEANTGAAIRSRVALTGADAGPDGTLRLSFDWNFISAETVADNAPGSNDFAIFSVTDGTAFRVFTLADARSTGFGASGWRTSVFDVSGVFGLPAVGALDLVIGFAVLNDQTPDNPSYLIVDNIRFNREIGGDYTLVGASGNALLQTWRQNPTAFDDAIAGAGTDVGTPITIAIADLIANDAASRGAATVTVTGVERVIDGVTGEPIGGRVELRDMDGDGRADAVVYDPRGRFDHLKEGEVATDHFIYRITDGNGGSDQARVAVRVTGVNNAPVAADDVIAGREDEALAGNVLADNGNGRDRDVDGDPLRVDTVPVIAPQYGALTLNADGTFVYLPDPDFHGVDTFTYRIFDRPVGGLSDSATVRLVIAPVNDAPIARDDVGRTDEDTVLILVPVANDSDVDTRDVLRPVAIAGNAVVAGQSVTLTSGAVATLNADGTISYDPRGAFAFLRAGEQATDTFAYTVGDGHGGSAEARITVTVDGRNDAPIAGLDRVAAQADAAVAIAASQLLANDIDVDLGDVLTVTAVDGSATKGIVSFDGRTLIYDPAGRFQALGAGESALDVIRYTVSDSTGLTAEGTIEVTVAGVNDPPQAVDDVAVTGERRAVVIDVLRNDRDPDSTDRISIVDFDTAGTRGTVSLNPDGTVTYSPNGAFDHLAAGQTATDRFRYVIADSSDARDTGEVTVTITGQSSVERLINSFEQPFRVEDISRGSSDAVAIKGQHMETDGDRGIYFPTDGNRLAWLEAYGTTRSTLDAFLGIDLRAHFTDIDGSLPASGAAFRLQVALDAGDELSFDWLFDARDTVSGSPADNDFALVTVGDENGINYFKLSDVRSTGDRGASGWLTTIFTASQSGTVTIAFAAVNDRASDMPSAGNPASENSMLLVDNLRVNRDFSHGYQVVEASGDGRFETVAALHA